MRVIPSLCFLLAVCSVDARQGSNSSSSSSSSKAVYVLTNNADNAVIGVPIEKNGLLGYGQIASTGGIGQSGVDSDGLPAGPDSLFSQGALAVAGEYVFAVNPGSSTLSMLKANHHNPSKLTLVGKPAPIPGDFPNTVAASVKGRLVCVGTTGTRAGVSCTTYSKAGLGEFDELRPFDLGQSNPAVGPENTLSHVLFSADESLLYAAVKGDGATGNLGFFAVYPVRYGCSDDTDTDTAASVQVAREGIQSSPPGTGLLFGAVVVPSSELIFVTDPFGATVLKVDRSTYEAAEVARADVPDQMAICWAAYSDKTNSVFVTDVAVNRLVELDATDARILLTADLPNDDPGLVDLQVVDKHIYALSPGNGTADAAITVFDIDKDRQVQRLSLAGFGAGPSAMGMAYLEL
ncbi:YncE family protein [Aspergillus undulatus]|uniref:YncE family protein n=1 Tax=Aspergillus undulatus TaxID=1810928 RepID=UPI003CCCB6C8